jgi:hypothetical protein
VRDHNQRPAKLSVTLDQQLTQQRRADRIKP